MFLFIPTSLILLDVSSMPWSAENELSSSIMLLVTCTCRVWSLQKDDLCACVLSHFSCVQLCDPMDCSLPGFSVYGILQARILECVAMPSSRGSSWPRDRNCISYVFWKVPQKDLRGYLLSLSLQQVLKLKHNSQLWDGVLFYFIFWPFYTPTNNECQ